MVAKSFQQLGIGPTPKSAPLPKLVASADHNIPSISRGRGVSPAYLYLFKHALPCRTLYATEPISNRTCCARLQPLCNPGQGHRLTTRQTAIRHLLASTFEHWLESSATQSIS